MLREPAVAGRFYPADPAVLRKDVEAFLSSSEPAQGSQVTGCIAPHAGYIYSGQVAGAVFSRIEVPSRCVILCPNHTGRGHPLAIMKEGGWRSPLGTVPIASDLAVELVESFSALSEDSAAHQSEHAIEVILPFLLVRNPDVKFVPIAVGTGQLLILESLGEAIAKVIRNSHEPVLIIASSDMNHYEDFATTRVKDHKAIARILALDPRGLHETVMNESISMCGFGPVVTMLTAARSLGAQRAELVQYATSAETSGDYSRVVGYAGITVQ